MMRRLLGESKRRTSEADARLPVIDGDLPIGLSPEEAAELAMLKNLSIDDEPADADADAAMPTQPEKENGVLPVSPVSVLPVSPVSVLPVSPVSVHTTARMVTVRLTKEATEEVGVDLAKDGIFGSIRIMEVKQGSPLLNEVFKGDHLLSINGVAVSDQRVAAQMLTTAGGQITLGVRRGEAAKQASTPKTSEHGPRYALHSLGRSRSSSDDDALLGAC